MEHTLDALGFHDIPDMRLQFIDIRTVKYTVLAVDFGPANQISLIVQILQELLLGFDSLITPFKGVAAGGVIMIVFKDIHPAHIEMGADKSQQLVDGSVDIPVSGTRYMIKIATESLSEELRAIIAAEAPRQSISKEAGGFTLGTFDSRDEVEILVSLLGENTTDQIEIIEIEINE